VAKYFERRIFTIMDTFGVVLGVISLVIAIIAEVRSAKLKHALEVKLSEIKAANSLIIKYAYDENCGTHAERLHSIQGIAETQKTMINGLKIVLKLRFWNLWEVPANDA
jgi:hypothetical protein